MNRAGINMSRAGISNEQAAPLTAECRLAQFFFAFLPLSKYLPPPPLTRLDIPTKMDQSLIC